MKCRHLHFPLSLFSVQRVFQLTGWPHGAGSRSRRELLARAETEFQSVFVPAAQSPRQLLPAQLLLESRAERPAICSVTSQEEEAGRRRMVSVWFVCLPLSLLYLAECCSCLLTLSMLPGRSFVHVAGVWKPSSSVRMRPCSV